MTWLKWLKFRRTPKHWVDDRSFEYGTHLPVLQSLLDVFRPQGVLELGAGLHSTALFHRGVKTFVSIETNEKWVEELRETIPQREHFALLHHRVAFSERTRYRAIPQAAKDEAVRYYEAVLARQPKLDLLFIDHVSGLRSHTLAALHPRFDLAVYHDAQDKGYGWDQHDFDHSPSHLHFVLKTFVPHTGILVRRTLADKLPAWKQALNEQTQAYFLKRYQFDLQERSAA